MRKQLHRLPPETCVYVPTGGAVPEGADSVVMIEYTEDYGDGTIGIAKSTAPGQNMIFRGDDVYPGKTILQKGRVLGSQDIARWQRSEKQRCMLHENCASVLFRRVTSLFLRNSHRDPGQVRDVNSPMLAAMLQAFGAQVKEYGIVVDNAALLAEKVDRALEECDAVLLSGGSSVGVKDATCRIIEERGTLLFHGIAVKPGKPTIFGKDENKPMIGLPRTSGGCVFYYEAVCVATFGAFAGAHNASLHGDGELKRKHWCQ